MLRGARQVGKTTLVKLFSKEFESFVSLNLELGSDRRNWEGDPPVKELLRNIEIATGTKIIPGKTLLFIDEIQNEPRAIQSLRYLYEERGELHVIATGSLMEVALRDKGFSFPVGRVSFLYLYPLSFGEFLSATDRITLLEELNRCSWNQPPTPSIHSLASECFREFLTVGGMPEVVHHYSQNQSYLDLVPLKEGLIGSFEEDVPKYARPAQVPTLQLLIRQAPLYAGQRIQYTNFANSGYQSREMKRAFEILEQAMIIQRIPATFHAVPPLQPHLRTSPKLLYLDAGLVTHRLSLDPNSLKTGDLNDLFRGTLAEQVVGQELMAQNSLRRDSLAFWHRSQPGSTAETDYCVTLKGQLVPIEVKSGKSGRLRSLFQFMQQAPHPHAVRIWSGPVQLDSLSGDQGRSFHLLSLPFYLAYRILPILENWIGS